MLSMISKFNSIKTNCGFLSDDINPFIVGFCTELGPDWECCPMEDAHWAIFHPECDLEFSVLPGEGNVYACETNLGTASEAGIDYNTARDWLLAKLNCFNKIKDMVLTTSMNSSIDKDELRIIKEVFNLLYLQANIN